MPCASQIFVALIAYLLLRLAQACQDTVVQPLAFARLVRLKPDAPTPHHHAAAT